MTDPRSEQIRFCASRDGTRIAYAVCGSGPPLVWSALWTHHLRYDWESPVWRPWLEMLARRHTLIRFDLRGCGLSDREGVEFTFDRLVEDLEAVVEAAGVERFAYFGMAVGSAVGMTYATRHPGRIERLVLYAAQARGRAAGALTPEQAAEAETRLKVIEFGWPNDNPAYGQFFTSLHIPDASTEAFRLFNELIRRTTSVENAMRLMRIFFHFDVSGIVPRVAAPSLVLHARGDLIIPFEKGRSVAAMIPGARFVPLESRNHVLLESEPAWRQLIDALDDFLPVAAGAGNGAAPLELASLTAREREVLEAVAQGLGNGEIAERLRISEKTVRNQVSIIFSKLGVTSRGQAIVRARDAGLGRGTDV